MKINLLQYEYLEWNRGVRHIAGVDEAGRGPLAGPLVVAAVILNRNHLTNNDISEYILGSYQNIKDSKLLTHKKRGELHQFITNNAISCNVEVIEHNQIDRIGISKCNQIGFYNAVSNLKVKPEHIFTDFFPINALNSNLQTNIKGGDGVSITVAAASIVAKVHRDKIMVEMHTKYPKYGFDRHKGYGTKEHKDKITKHGYCEIHRRSFEPVKSMLKTSKSK